MQKVGGCPFIFNLTSKHIMMSRLKPIQQAFRLHNVNIKSLTKQLP